MTIIFDMVKGSIQSELQTKAPTTGHCETLSFNDLPSTLLEVQVHEAAPEPVGHGILHIQGLLHKD